MREYTREGLFVDVMYLSKYTASAEQALLMGKCSHPLSMGGWLIFALDMWTQKFFWKIQSAARIIMFRIGYTNIYS